MHYPPETQTLEMKLIQSLISVKHKIKMVHRILFTMFYKAIWDCLFWFVMYEALAAALLILYKQKIILKDFQQKWPFYINMC